MKINFLRAILIVLLILQMWIIFGFSNQDGDTSGSVSREITETIVKNIKSIQNLEKDEKEKILNKFEHIVRKMAHFSIYMIIGLLLMSLMSTYKIKQINRISISGIIGLVYAISDEIHQAFVPGRGPMVGDVCIDFCGVITGVVVVIIAGNLYRKYIRCKRCRGRRPRRPAVRSGMRVGGFFYFYHLHNKKINDRITLNKKRRKRDMKKVIKTILIIFLILIVLLALGGVGGYLFIKSKLGKLQYEEISQDATELGISEESQEKTSPMQKFRNIALLGVDSQTDDYDTGYRTDCIMVASINEETGNVQLFSIYRDTYVKMEENGKIRLDKINHAYYGGAQNTLKTINTNLDLNITEFVLADFSAVKDLVNEAGGIEIDITSEELKYINRYIDNVNKVTKSNSKHITKTGTQTLDGVQAVAYCRIRYTEGWDYKRTERIRTVLEKVVQKAKKMNASELNRLADNMLPKIKTNIKANEIIGLIPKAIKFNIEKSFGWPYSTTGVTLNGQFYGPAATLETNVVKLHKEVFGQKDYVVNDTVKAISDEIEEKTGVHATEKIDIGN